MKNLTERQSEILSFISEIISNEGMPPTRKEIALKFGFKSANSAEEHLKALDKKGYIDLHGGTSRGISINKSFLGIPIVGSVAAGSPLLAVENVEERIEFNGNIFSDSVDYFLRVKGDSMNEVGIVEGDLIAINKRKDVKPGDIVVARINDDVTVKTLFHLDKRKVILRPENKNYKDIEINPSIDFLIVLGISCNLRSTNRILFFNLDRKDLPFFEFKNSNPNL